MYNFSYVEKKHYNQRINMSIIKCNGIDISIKSFSKVTVIKSMWNNNVGNNQFRTLTLRTFVDKFVILEKLKKKS